MALLILIVSVGYLISRTKKDVTEYEKFKELKSSAERIKIYRRWTISSFLQFGIFSSLSLLVLKQINVLWAPLPALRKVIDLSRVHIDVGFLSGLTTAILMVVTINIYINKKSRNAKSKTKHLVIGDIEELIPKNNQERIWGSLLAINAGFSEELFFRALLPVLLYLSFGVPIAAIVVSNLVFGLVHYYQGTFGVLATIFIGGVLMTIYLASGNILIPMLVHTAVDLASLIIRPVIVELLNRRT